MDKKLTKQNKEKKPLTLRGTVVSQKMKDTAVVSVTRFVKHNKYKKFYKVSKRYKVHDAGNTKKVGEIIDIVETRPISKEKRFKVI